MKPHCFSQAACFCPSARVCQKCPFNIACAQQVMSRLLIINDTLEVSDLIVDTQKFLSKHSPDVDIKLVTGDGKCKTFLVDVDLSHYGQRVQKIVTTVLRRGIDIRADIRHRRNQLAALKPRHLYAVQEYLSRHGAISHEQLKILIQQHNPDSKERSVSNSASWTASALLAMRVVNRYGEQYVLTD